MVVDMAADLSLGTSHLPPLRFPYPSHSRPLQQDHLRALQLYHQALEHERQKIEAFQRELPFCMQLLDDAIEASREQLADCSTARLKAPLQLLCSHNLDAANVRNDLPELGDYMHVNRKRDKKHDECSPEKQELAKRPTEGFLNRNPEALNQAGPERHCNAARTHPSPERGISTKRCFGLQELRNPEVLKYWDNTSKLVASSNEKAKVNLVQIGEDDETSVKDSINGVVEPSLQREPCRAARSSTRQPGLDVMSSANGEKEPAPPFCAGRSSSYGQAQRKPRRSWSPELHQRFLKALQQLGGCQAATPKQIRELMNVEGLTNDEVKSHLQKFRLHMRRPSPSLPTDPKQAAHLVVFGHIWMPQEYENQRAAAASQQASLGLYNSSVHKSNVVPPSLLPKDLLSHLNPPSHVAFSGSRKQPHLVCHKLLTEAPNGSDERLPVEESEISEARSDNTSLNENEDEEKTQDHLQRFQGSAETNTCVKAVVHAANEERAWVESLAGTKLAGNDTFQRNSITPSIHRTPELQTFLTAPLQLNRDDTCDQPKRGRVEAPGDDSYRIRRSTVQTTTDLTVGCGVVAKQGCS